MGRMSADQPRNYPSELPALALRETVVFPLTLQPIALTRPLSIDSVNRALAGDRLLFLALQTTDDEEPQPEHLKKVGTIAAIRQMAKVPNGGVHVVVEGLARARADLVTRSGQILRAAVTPAPEQLERTLEVDAYVRRIRDLIDRALSVTSGLSQELRTLVMGIDDPLRLAYLLASLLDLKGDEKQQILEATDLIAKLKEQKYLNDSRYASSYSQYRQSNEKFGRRRVVTDLKAKGVHSEIIQQAVSAAYNDVNEEQLARQFLERKRLKKPQNERESARIFRRLVRAGFSAGTIFKVLKRWDVEDEVLTALSSEAEESSTE